MPRLVIYATAAMLLLGAAPMPYGYYTLLRLVGFIVFAVAAFAALARRYATGGQKSVHELFLTPFERDTLVGDMRALLDLATDRFFLLRLDPRSRVFTLGKAVPPADPDHFYLG